MFIHLSMIYKIIIDRVSCIECIQHDTSDIDSLPSPLSLCLSSYHGKFSFVDHFILFVNCTQMAAKEKKNILKILKEKWFFYLEKKTHNYYIIVWGWKKICSNMLHLGGNTSFEKKTLTDMIFPNESTKHKIGGVSGVSTWKKATIYKIIV